MKTQITVTYTKKEACEFIASHLAQEVEGFNTPNTAITVTIERDIQPSLDNSVDVPQAVIAALFDNNLIAACKYTREHFNCNLMEAKNYCEHVKYNLLKMERISR